MIVGVDEAGRGPVLGSMFVAAVAAPNEAVLPDGIRDSKQLPVEERDRLAEEIELSAAHVAVVEVTRDEIDNDERNLNALTLRASAEAVVDALGSDRSGAHVIADACDVNADRYREQLRDRLPDGIQVHAVHGADAASPIVGAASIMAKSRREMHVAELSARFGDIGSGYPSDPATRAFLSDHVASTGDLPACARRSWQTCADLLAAVEQGHLSDFA